MIYMGGVITVEGQGSSMEKLSREQILDLLARAEAELLRICISQQPQLLKKPLGLLRKADNACSDVLPRQVYESKCQQFLLILSQAMEQAIEQDDRNNLKEITELAASILNQLYTNLKDEPALSRLARQKKEIVFLPYKAAMWDSLESIWKASIADPEHCHSYVIPIPYADRNPDGTVKEWHNERNLFPGYVPTLDCETFDLEALHPDVIFIHNPYDSCNQFNRNSIQLRKLGACPKPLETRGFGDSASFESDALYQISNQL